MRSTISWVGVIVIVLQSCGHVRGGQGSANGVVSRLERVAELMLSNPDRCGKHGTTESEIIPVINCGDKICRLPDSICQYNFVVDQFACFNLSGDCKQLIAEKVKTSKNRLSTKSAKEARRNQIIQSVLRARSSHKKENDEKDEKPEKIPSYQKSIPAIIRTKAGKIRITPARNATRRLRFKAVGARTVSGRPIRIDSDSLVKAAVKEDIKEETNNASVLVSQSPRVESKRRKIRRKLIRLRSSNGKARALGAEIHANSGSAIPLPSENNGSPPRAQSGTEIRAGNTEALRGRNKAQVRPLRELVDEIKQQLAALASSTEIPPPETSQAGKVEEKEPSYIHLPRRPTFGQKTRSSGDPASSRKLASRTTTAAPSEEAKGQDASVEANAGNTKQLAKVLQRHRLNKKNNNALIGERLLAIRPSQSASQTSEVKQVSESIDDDSKKQSAEHVSAEKQPSAEPEPVKSSTDKSDRDSSHEQPAPEPEPTTVVNEKSTPGDSKKVHSHEFIPGLEGNKEELEEFFGETESKEKPKEEEEEGHGAEGPGGDDEKEDELLSGEVKEIDETVSESSGEVEGSGEELSGDSEDEEGGQSASDWHRSCCEWASEGQCLTNRAFMLPMCQKSCGSYRCMWDNLNECSIKVNLSHCVNRSPVSKIVDERTTGVIRRRRLRTKVHSGGRIVELEDPIPLTLLQATSGHRGVRVGLRKVIDN